MLINYCHYFLGIAANVAKERQEDVNEKTSTRNYC